MHDFLDSPYALERQYKHLNEKHNGDTLNHALRFIIQQFHQDRQLLRRNKRG